MVSDRDCWMSDWRRPLEGSYLTCVRVSAGMVQNKGVVVVHSDFQPAGGEHVVESARVSDDLLEGDGGAL